MDRELDGAIIYSVINVAVEGKNDHSPAENDVAEKRKEALLEFLAIKRCIVVLNVGLERFCHLLQNS